MNNCSEIGKGKLPRPLSLFITCCPVPAVCRIEPPGMPLGTLLGMPSGTLSGVSPGISPGTLSETSPGMSPGMSPRMSSERRREHRQECRQKRRREHRQECRQAKKNGIAAFHDYAEFHKAYKFFSCTGFAPDCFLWQGTYVPLISGSSLCGEAVPPRAPAPPAASSYRTPRSGRRRPSSARFSALSALLSLPPTPLRIPRFPPADS